MRREVLLTAHEHKPSPECIAAEKRMLSKVFIYMESFETFVLLNDIFDLDTKKPFLEAEDAVIDAYRLKPRPFQFIISRN